MSNSGMLDNTRVGHEKAVLVGVMLQQDSIEDVTSHVEELARLVESAGAQVVDSFIVPRKKFDPALYIGKGKVEEIAEFAKAEGVNLVVFNNELSPRQGNNLHEALGVKVLDRTELILDIFAKRAQTQEGKLQVEIAQLQYMLPRLVGCWTHLSRQEGGIGTVGPGETQLEIDRRRLSTRIKKLRSNLEAVKRHRQTQRKSRQRAERLSTVALAGYTNAGKSTLLEALTGSTTLVEDKLFATLDPLAKRVPLKDIPNLVVVDTVGFLRGLPHGLVESFKATLEEVHVADLIVHVIDGASPIVEDQIKAVKEVLEEIDAQDIPIVEVVNKIDVINHETLARLKKNHPDAVFISARRAAGINGLITKLREKLKQDYRVRILHIPHTEPKVASKVFSCSNIVSKHYEDEYLVIEAEMSHDTAQLFARYLVESQ